MANTAHLFRRQSSRDLNGSHRDYTKTLDELELKVPTNDDRINKFRGRSCESSKLV